MRTADSLSTFQDLEDDDYPFDLGEPIAGQVETASWHASDAAATEANG